MPVKHDHDLDVIVIGAGPAGASAALAAAQQGARTLLLERATLPRYKRCGGGLTGASIAALPAGFAPPMRDRVGTVTMSRGLARDRTRTGPPFVAMVDRAEFDQALVHHAQGAGVQVRQGVGVRRVYAEDGTLELRDGTRLSAAAIVVADGAHSSLAREIGVRTRQVDFALEVEVPVPPQIAQKWSGHLHLDVGTVPGGYGWLFPKGQVLTVGVIAPEGDPDALRHYLADYLAHLQLDHLPQHHAGGHHTRTRTADSPLRSGTLIAAGDAAGWVDPFMREGISYALRSGRAAGLAAAAVAEGHDPDAPLAACRAELQPELDAGFAILGMMRRSPWAMHAAVTRTSAGWRALQRIAGGDASLQRAMRHRLARRIVHALD